MTTDHEKNPAQGGEIPPVERAADTGGGGIDTVRGATSAGNVAQRHAIQWAHTRSGAVRRSTDASKMARRDYGLADNDSARHDFDAGFRYGTKYGHFTSARAAGAQAAMITSLECAAQWLEHGKDPKAAAAEIRACLAKLDATPAAPVAIPACATCNDHGMIDGPSFYAPDEGGLPCPDCAASVAADGRPDEWAAFDAWARDEGLIQESHGVRSVNSMCDVARKAWSAALASQAAAPHTSVADDPLRERVTRLLVDLHAGAVLSEGQCSKVLDIHRIDWRKIVDESAIRAPKLFTWPPLPTFPESFAHVAGHAYFTAHQMQGYANAYGKAIRESMLVSEADARTLTSRGYTYHGSEQWKPPLGERPEFARSGQRVESGCMPSRSCDFDVNVEMDRFDDAMRKAFDYAPDRNEDRSFDTHPEDAHLHTRDRDRFMGWCMAMQTTEVIRDRNRSYAAGVRDGRVLGAAEAGSSDAVRRELRNEVLFNNDSALKAGADSLDRAGANSEAAGVRAVAHELRLMAYSVARAVTAAAAPAVCATGLPDGEGSEI
ncbi:hypothetical protein [Burkholderia gladioli]|uniref:hypothetical protein n=1 Tax=Burkholderia gladioli TaxID=28095 RepID=UPI0016410639|nr:hypothetical protein [Burkholderia gladioli]